jgi:predicted acylesterase/phospholipase RssA
MLTTLCHTNATRKGSKQAAMASELYSRNSILRRRRLGLALGGGGMRGLAHLGVLRAFERAGIFPDLISGTSMGAVMGALYSWGYAPDAILEIFHEGAASGWLWHCLPGGEVLKTWSLFRFGGWRRRLRRYLAVATLEQLPIPVYPVSVDLVSGTCVVRDRGDAVEALLESTNLPGLNRPILRNGAALVDGGVLNNVPADVARDRGADVVLAVDVSRPTASPQETGFLKVLLRVLELQQSGGLARQADEADLVITPGLGDHGVFCYDHLADVVRAGEIAAEEALPRLRSLLRRQEG